MTRNRALRAIEELVHAKERAVLFAAGEWFEYTPDDDKAMTLKYRLADTVKELKDALALLAQATGQGQENGAEPASTAPRIVRTS